MGKLGECSNTELRKKFQEGGSECTQGCRVVGDDENGEMSLGSRENISDPSKIHLRGFLGGL